MSRTLIIGRLIQNVIRGYAGLVKSRYLVETRTGLSLLLDQRNTVDRALLFYGEWEPAQVAMLRRLIARQRSTKSARNVFLDIGAHGGLYSMWLARDPGFDRLIAFEPEPQNHAQLRANLFMNGFTRTVEACELAVSDATGEASIYAHAHGNRGGSRIDPMDHASEFDDPVTVRTIAIDEFVREEGCRIVAKIDVEGHELPVLRGMRQLLERNDCLLQIEIWPITQDAVTSLLAECGYRHIETVQSDFFFMKQPAA